MKDLFAAGAHYGHIRGKYNPRMRQFVFGVREGVYLIDLEKTVTALSRALDYLKTQKKEGKEILFICTKDSVRANVREVAQKTGMPYMTGRWPGGMLTNFNTIRRQLTKLRELEALIDTDEWEAMTKRERLTITRQINKLNSVFEGVKELKKIPETAVLFDTIQDSTALAEARKSHMGIVSIVDTNSDPTGIDFPIPASDDAKKVTEMILGEMEKALA